MIKYHLTGTLDIFAKIKADIEDSIAKLEKEAANDATEKAYCDEEMTKSEAKKVDLEADVTKFSARIDKAATTSEQRKTEVAELQEQLAKLAKEQSSDHIR